MATSWDDDFPQDMLIKYTSMSGDDFRRLYQQEWPPSSRKAEEILAVMLESEEGRYLLPRRYGPPPPDDQKQEVDHLYDACQELARAGLAQRISPFSDAGPGYELTNKGWRLVRPR